MAKPFHVSRSLDIDAPAERVQALINDLRRWPTWSPWDDKDPDMERTWSGSNSGVGAIYGWRGNSEAGQARLEVVASTPTHVGLTLLFAAPMKGANHLNFHLTPSPDASSTRVEWSMTGPQNLVMRFMGIFMPMDKVVGPDFERGLKKLKSVAEGQHS